MTTADLIRYLRLSVNVQLEDSTERDELYLKMSDEDLTLYLNLARTRAFADEDLSDFPEEYMYPLSILARRELYLALAIRHANYIDIGADDNNYLKKSQWFNHYMTLVNAMDGDWDKYLDEGGAGSNTLCSASTYLSNRYYTPYNYEKAKMPTLKAKIDSVEDSSIEISWKATYDRHLCYEIYVSTSPIADSYALTGEISPLAKKVSTITDPHKKRCRIVNCEKGATYYILVRLLDWTGRSAYSELTTIIPDDTDTLDDVEEVSL